MKAFRRTSRPHLPSHSFRPLYSLVRAGAVTRQTPPNGRLSTNKGNPCGRGRQGSDERTNGILSGKTDKMGSFASRSRQRRVEGRAHEAQTSATAVEMVEVRGIRTGVERHAKKGGRM